MLSNVSYESLHFLIPAAKVNEIAAWILLSDDAYMQSEINKHGARRLGRDAGLVAVGQRNRCCTSTIAIH